MLTSKPTRGRSRSLTDGRPAGFVNPDDGASGDVFDVTDLDELGQRKYAAHILHDALLAWEAGVRDVEHEKPILDVHRALDFLCFGHWANLRRIQKRERTPGRRRNRSPGLTR